MLWHCSDWFLQTWLKLDFLEIHFSLKLWVSCGVITVTTDVDTADIGCPNEQMFSSHSLGMKNKVDLCAVWTNTPQKALIEILSSSIALKYLMTCSQVCLPILEFYSIIQKDFPLWIKYFLNLLKASPWAKKSSKNIIFDKGCITSTFQSEQGCASINSTSCPSDLTSCEVWPI